MSISTEQRRLAAIMFTDMVGYSAGSRVWTGFEAIMPDIVAYPGIPSTLFSQQFRIHCQTPGLRQVLLPCRVKRGRNDCE